MKKTILALAILTASGTTFAQSSVTVWGVLDTALTSASGSIAKKTSLTNSSSGSSQLGFRGSEDLGGGMYALFWLEAGLNVDSGLGAGTSINNQTGGNNTAPSGTQGLTFARRSTVSLAGSLGELRLGRDYTPQFWSMTQYDPFYNNGAGGNVMSTFGGTLTPGGTTGTLVRASNSVSYLWNHRANDNRATGGQGFTADIQHYYGENASNVAAPVGKNDGTGTGVRVGYNAGPLSVHYASSKTTFLAASATTGDVKTTNLAGSYDMGVAKVMFTAATDKVGAKLQGKGRLIGLTAPVAGAKFKVASSQYETNAIGNPTAKKIVFGVEQPLSKRTYVYVISSRITNSGGTSFALGGSTTAANQSSKAMDIGLLHRF
jgi:predicted porin